MIFWGGNFVSRFSGQKGLKQAKNEVFQILRKVDTQNFLIFLDNITYQLKIDLNNMTFF